jgi:hypothetical protein
VASLWVFIVLLACSTFPARVRGPIVIWHVNFLLSIEQEWGLFIALFSVYPVWYHRIMLRAALWTCVLLGVLIVDREDEFETTDDIEL